MKLLVLFVLTSLVLGGCGGSKATTTTTTGPSPVVTVAPTFTLSGTVSSAAGGGIGGASVSIGDSVNAGRSTTTDGAGRYTLAGLTVAGFTVGIGAGGFVGASRGLTLTSDTTANFTLLPSALYIQSGAGNTVFDMPTYLTRVRIQGTWNQTGTSNFIVTIGGRLVVNEILRTPITYDGIHITTGGVVAITNSSAIAWTFTEVR